MSQPKMLGAAVAGTATAASLPVTGNPVVTMVFAGVAITIAGLLVLRAGRYRRSGV